jgi:hypothetical protein
MESEKPELLYKFMGFNENALKVLINNQLYFAKLKELNDPADSCRKIRIENILKYEKNPELFYEFVKRNINYLFPYQNPTTILSQIKYEKDLFIRLVNNLFENIANEKYGICSFCHAKNIESGRKIIENPLMWSHYADSSKGICLVFDKELIFKNSNEFLNNGTQIKVRYKKPHKIPEVIKPVVLDGDFWDLIEYNYFSYKVKKWKYEKEFRFLMEIGFSYNEKDNSEIRLHNFEPNALKEIIIGEKFLSFNLKTIVNLRKKGYSFKLYQILRELETKQIYRQEIQI